MGSNMKSSSKEENGMGARPGAAGVAAEEEAAGQELKPSAAALKPPPG